MKKITVSAIASVAILFGAAQQLHAHASFVKENAYAGSRYVATANIPHGCSDLNSNTFDTIMIEVSIPGEFTSVRPMDSTFGAATLEKDGEGNVTKITWTKSSEALDEDSHFYQVSFRGRLPDTPLHTLGFEITQICAGDTSRTWDGDNTPSINILPSRSPGWNKYTAQSDISEDTIASFFSDAEIVWSNDSAYSSNPVISDLIESPLTIIPAGEDYWVKY